MPGRKQLACGFHKNFSDFVSDYDFKSAVNIETACFNNLCRLGVFISHICKRNFFVIAPRLHRVVGNMFHTTALYISHNLDGFIRLTANSEIGLSFCDYLLLVGFNLNIKA